MFPDVPRASLRVRRACLLGCLALAGCGGGLFVGIGDDLDEHPDVDLTVSPAAAGVGQFVRLAAAASDDFGVREVEFFRLDVDGRGLFLGSDRTRPYQLDTAVPDASAATVQYFARAIDDVGQRSDSELVSVTVLR